ncbi:hypothetical protein WA1_33280 [Scytonema hofmannii PCC 7110]|uniref:Uncharacterized protein n=1 Tax=Scytonema hofmannii PCC 7110 TaxID=128403 RepID=A0A139X2G9_9CYAN|nr:hypothetical protein [Scytonema hofmannii]KYC38888.1 hypothetical protein WA1_33280 [Scytonema hofmannii PCC 7110]
MNKWQQTKKTGTDWIRQFQTSVVRALQAIEQWSRKVGRGGLNRHSLGGFLSLVFVGTTLSVAIATVFAKKIFICI